MILSRLFREFIDSEKSGGVLLIACTLISLVLANSPWGTTYEHLWHIEVAGHSIAHWINDGLMTVFFLLIGLELERELYVGEMSNLKDARLPLAAAIGGMLLPASFYLLLNAGTPLASGSGVPTATDIAFALAVLSLLGNKVPATLKVFLTALAVIDDLGAILVIAIFYSQGIEVSYLLASLGVFGLLLLLNRLRVHSLWPYIAGGLVMWYCMLHSGVHATITGVLLAFAIPFGNGDPQSPSYRLQHTLHYPVAFAVLPLFALANTAIIVRPEDLRGLTQPIGIGIMLGLLIGKPLGVWLLSRVAVAMRWGRLPEGMNWWHILGAGILAGIGFTMSIFITLLAFSEPTHINSAKLAVMVASFAAGGIGYVLFRRILRPQPENDELQDLLAQEQSLLQRPAVPTSQQ